MEESVLDIDSSALTPGMRQYQEVKRAHPDCLVMLRMGDFYEMFYEDAVAAARELEIVLTARGKGEKQAPLAGVPYHSLDNYLGKLVKKGYKIAIVEQLEDPAKAKGLVKRGLVRIVTPGTIVESSLLQENENNYIIAIAPASEGFALACCDISTGEFTTSLADNLASLHSELARLNPSECIIPTSLSDNKNLVEKIKSLNCFLNLQEDYFFQLGKARTALLEHFNLLSLDSFGLEELKNNIAVCGGLLHYLINTQKNALTHLRKISLRSTASLLIDGNTLRNLEIVRNMRDSSSKGTLLSVLDKTATPMGARLLKKWIKAPLLSREQIEKRLDAVQELADNFLMREEISSCLHSVYDLERLQGRINYGNANPRDLLALKQSLLQIPKIKKLLEKCFSHVLQEIYAIPDMNEIVSLIDSSVREDAPIALREGGIIKSEYHLELASLHEISRNSRQYLQKLEEREKEKTGISSLKIGYTHVFGYFIEITKKNLSKVPADYIRKQTTANAERYITDELKLEEEKIFSADEKAKEWEFQLFQEIIRFIAEKTAGIQNAAEQLAALDVFCSLAKTASAQRYVRPEFIEKNIMHIIQGRHPVLEQLEPRFIPNNVMLEEQEMMIITGPNMAGKSSVMRQTALIALMAQMGSFVPAEKATLGIVDRIFTRVGAADDLSSGQSTFMVEMSETAAILHNATEKSLIILDEIGRGTSTFDGVSIAWSVAEHIHHKIKAKTLFATHYHVLNKLAGQFSRIKNYTVAVKENSGEIIFLYKLIPGSTDQSYGIHVAKAAGLPFEVTERAKEIQAVLEKDDEMMQRIKAKRLSEQLSLEKF